MIRFKIVKLAWIIALYAMKGRLHQLAEGMGDSRLQKIIMILLVLLDVK